MEFRSLKDRKGDMNVKSRFIKQPHQFVQFIIDKLFETYYSQHSVPKALQKTQYLD